MKKYSGMFLYSILGGFCISLGATVFLRLKDAFPGGHVVGALLFAVGLFTICTRGYILYTGRVGYLFDNPLPGYLFDLVVIWVGNFVGCLLLAVLQTWTTVFDGLQATAMTMVEGKMAASYLSLFILGIFCNIFMFIAVNGYAKNPHELGKYLAIFLGVSVFILSGTEHCIADMYYWAISGILYDAPGETLLRLFIITLGNAVGGVFFPVFEKAKARLDAPSHKDAAKEAEKELTAAE